MTKKTLLIDAAHPEETRIVILKDNRLDEFEFESSAKKQVKGNVYLAKIVRVEPSLQAAFVDFGENRHGFLAFSEIHPDYYRVPVGDRQSSDDISSVPASLLVSAAKELLPPPEESPSDEEFFLVRPSVEEIGGELPPEHEEDELGEEPIAVVEPGADNPDDTIEEVKQKRSQKYLNYKIQEVIKKRQILLVQVEKEERGTKGAAITTYLSLAGRYCVLMPNTPDAGGVSRKITNLKDRRRLKKILSELNVPEGMSIIIRTAGMGRTKIEIRKDYEYLLRQWEDIRTKTLESTAPAMVYEEANIIKRAIRDYYSKDVDQILVEGEVGHKIAKDFIRDLTPSHAKKVQQFKDPAVPLFRKFRVEEQMEELYSNKTKLRSGGSIVINQTEALVAIDINSGQSTRERHIEETAFNTNLEAAEEIARQLRLRDFAGLIVIDFIDMDNPQHIVAVEQKLKESLKNDRARIQIGSISAFGLLELSRQRLRPSIFETTMTLCQACQGTGHIRSVQSTVMKILRILEDETARTQHNHINVYVPATVAFYLLNQKRQALSNLETQSKVSISVLADDTLPGSGYRLDYVGTSSPNAEQPSPQKSSESGQPKQAQRDQREPREQRDQRENRDNRHDDRKRRAENGRPDGGRPDNKRHKSKFNQRPGRRDRFQEGGAPYPASEENLPAIQQQPVYDEQNAMAEGYVELESHRLQKQQQQQQQQQQNRGKKRHNNRDNRGPRPQRERTHHPKASYEAMGLPQDDGADDVQQPFVGSTSAQAVSKMVSDAAFDPTIQPIIPHTPQRRSNLSGGGSSGGGNVSSSGSGGRPPRRTETGARSKIIPITPLTSIDETPSKPLPDVFRDPRENETVEKPAKVEATEAVAPKESTGTKKKASSKSAASSASKSKRKGWWQKEE